MNFINTQVLLNSRTAKKFMTVQIRADIHAWIKETAEQLGCDMNELSDALMRDAVDAYKEIQARSKEKAPVLTTTVDAEDVALLLHIDTETAAEFVAKNAEVLSDFIKAAMLDKVEEIARQQ